MNKISIKLNNVLFPIWMLLFIPSPLWLLIIPGNYIIDRIVLYLSMKDYPERKAFCKQNTWKICLAGFGADFAGAVLLFLCSNVSVYFKEGSFMERMFWEIDNNPFDNVGSFLLVAASIIIAGIIIYYLDRSILKQNGLEETQAKKSSLWMAIATAPYLFLIPTKLIYD